MARKKADSCEEEEEVIPIPLPHLPQHLLAEILSKVPIKSLLRFKCVSKSWRSLISDSHFTKSHFNQSVANSTKNILIVIATSDLPSFRFYSAKLGSSNNNMVAENIDFSFRNKVRSDIQIIGSCNGLICMKVDSQFLYVYNISTRESVEITGCDFGCDIGFGYDHRADDQKLVKITFDSIHVFPLRIGRWRKVLDFPRYSVHVLGKGTELNGAIHWLCVKKIGPDEEELEIAAFSLVDEKLSKFPLPTNSGEDFEDSYLGVFEGCICIFARNDQFFHVTFWIMKGYGVEQSWSKLEINHPFPLVCDETLVFMNYDHKVVLYNTREGTYRKIVIPDLKEYDSVEATIYVQSLLSPRPHESGIEIDQIFF